LELQGNIDYICNELLIKVKVNLLLCLNCGPRCEGVLGSGSIAPFVCDLGTRCGSSSSRTSRVTPIGRLSVTHWIGGWVGRRVRLNFVVKWTIRRTCRLSKPQIIERCTTELSWLL